MPIYTYTNNNHIPEKNTHLYRFKMEAKIDFLLRRKQPRDQNLKNRFPNEIFNEIWPKLGDYENIYIPGIKL